jgi:hypothetical protein
VRYVFVLAFAVPASLALTAHANAFTSTHCSISGSISEPDSLNTPQHLILQYTGELAGSALTPSEDKACEYYERGLVYHLTGQYDRAIADYSKALGWMSEFGEAHAALGDAYAATSQPGKAREEYNEASRIDQNNADALIEICRQRAYRGTQLDLALSTCDRAMDLRHPDSGPSGARCLVNYRLGRYDAAISDCDAAISLGSIHRAQQLYVRGLAKIKSGDRDGGNTDIAAAKDDRRTIIEDQAVLGFAP